MVAAPGMEHGGFAVLVLTGLILLAAIAGWLAIARVLALLAFVWIARAAYELPGALTENGAWLAELTWGIGVALLGSVLALVAARPARA